jgi:hypothetical protein
MNRLSFRRVQKFSSLLEIQTSPSQDSSSDFLGLGLDLDSRPRLLLVEMRDVNLKKIEIVDIRNIYTKKSNEQLSQKT